MRTTKIGDIHNGNFIGIVKRLSKYDPVLNEHLSKVRDSEEKETVCRHINYKAALSTNVLTFVAEWSEKTLFEKLIDKTGLDN